VRGEKLEIIFSKRRINWRLVAYPEEVLESLHIVGHGAARGLELGQGNLGRVCVVDCVD